MKAPFFYGLLDTVHLDPRRTTSEERRHRVLNAHATIMLDMLVTRATPVFSQNQVFDQLGLLSLVGQQDEDSYGLLQLARSGRVRVCINDDDMLRASAGESNPFTIKNAFVSRFASGFHFSAWPELDDSKALGLVRRRLTEEPSLDLGDTALTRKVEALELLSAAFDASNHVQPARRMSPTMLYSELEADCAARAANDPVRRLWQDVNTYAKRNKIELQSRSQLYKALKGLEHDRQFLSISPRTKHLRELIDFHYNRIVALSVGAISSFDEFFDLTATALFLTSRAKPILSDRVSTMLPITAFDNWLSWRDMPDRLERHEFDPPQLQIDRLEKERLAFQVDEHAFVIAARILPAGAMGIAADMTASAFGGNPLVTGLCGVVGLGLGVLPPLQRLVRKEIEPHVRALAERQVRRSIASRANSAQEHEG
jgi:hypothetical protein